MSRRTAKRVTPVDVCAWGRFPCQDAWRALKGIEKGHRGRVVAEYADSLENQAGVCVIENIAGAARPHQGLREAVLQDQPAIPGI